MKALAWELCQEGDNFDDKDDGSDDKFSAYTRHRR